MVDGSRAYVNANVVVYIANEEGKKAVWVLSQKEDYNEKSRRNTWSSVPHACTEQ
jgi:hypothetical protein